MTASFYRYCGFIVLIMLTIYGPNVTAAIDSEDQAIIDSASCTELAGEYPGFVAAEAELSNNIKNNTQATIVTNLIGVATLATLGLGIFSWDDSSDLQANLEEIQQLRVAIETAIKRKACLQ